MAQGDTKLFNDYVLKDRQGSYSSADDYRLAFVSDTFAAINSDATNPTLATFTNTSGGNVAANYALANESFTRSGATITFDADDIGTITKSASNPADLRCAILYNATVSNDAIQAWDCTSDGTTPLDLVNNDFTFSFGASGIQISTNNNT
jgi:hypothetical protein